MTHRSTGMLRPHEHVTPDLGWTVVPDLNPDRPFHELAFASTPSLQRAGIIPASGVKIAYREERKGRTVHATTAASFDSFSKDFSFTQPTWSATSSLATA
jgi:hypothetical protein